MSPSTRLPGLDGLRAISALLVIACHISMRERFAESVFSKGAFGVQIFFVISGFIITYILLREEEKTGSLDLKRFYIRRAFRILPPAYTYLAVLVVLSLLGLFRLSRTDICTALFFGANFYHGSVLTGHFWSLAIEEQFYLVWPFVLSLVPARRRLVLCVALCVIVPAWRQISVAAFGRSSFDWERTDYNCNALLTGAALALCWVQPRVRAWGESLARFHTAIFIVAASLLCFTVFIRGSLPLGLNYAMAPISYCCVAAMIAVLISGRSRAVNVIFNWRPMVWAGRVSYSLYLWQQITIFRPISAGWIGCLIGVALAFVLASLSYYFIERPALQFRARLEARRTASPEMVIA